MDKIGKGLSFLRKKVRLNILILLFILILGILLFFELTKEAEAEGKISLKEEPISSQFLIIEGNSLQAQKNPLFREPENEILKITRIEVIATGYSSSPWETDDSPFITAAGTQVREGIVATNILPFGTKIKLPELYGDRIFVVEDRMREDRNYHIDIWFPTYWQAKNFGVKRTYIEILEG